MENDLLVSFVVTTFNKEKYINKVISSILAQKIPKNLYEIIIVDDNSTDQTVDFAKQLKIEINNLSILIKSKKSKKGPASSSNLGIKKAKGKFIASVDGDAFLKPNWFSSLIREFENKKVAIVSGIIYTANSKNIWASFSGRELEDRMLRLSSKEVDSISPCNTLYRREIFNDVGYFDESFDYYAQDVEFCYRVRNSGYKILISQKSGCYHFWRENFKSLFRQVFGTGYGRLSVLEKFPEMKTGDSVSNWKLIIQIPMTLLLILLSFASLLFKLPMLAYLSFGLLLFIIVAQIPLVFRIVKRTGDFRFFLFPLFLMVRNIIWVWAFIVFNFHKYLKFL